MAVLTRIRNGWLSVGWHKDDSDGVCCRITFLYVPDYADRTINDSRTSSCNVPVPLHLYSADIKLLDKNNTWEETADRLKHTSAGIHHALKGTQYAWYGASCESLRTCPTRCQHNQLLTRNRSPSTLQQVLLRTVSKRICALAGWPFLFDLNKAPTKNHTFVAMENTQTL